MNREPEHTDGVPDLIDADECWNTVSPDDPLTDDMAVERADAEVDSEGVIRSGKLAGRSLTSAIWILAFPVFLQQTMQACVGLFDKIIAGDLPEAIRVAALDGVGVGSFVGWLIGISMAGLGIGGQAIIARAIGAGRVGEADQAVGQAIALSLIWGAIVGFALWWLVIPLAAMAGLTEAASLYCYQYVRTIAFAMPLCGVMMVGAMCMHGAGETLRPSLIAISVNVINMFFTWMLSGADVVYAVSESVVTGETVVTEHVINNPFGFDLNVIGIAGGTAISYLCGAVITWFVLIRGVKDLQLRTAQMPLERVMIRRVVRVGVPNFFEGISMWAVNIVVLVFIGWIAATGNGGAGLQGAHVIAIQWEAFSFMPGFAIGTAAGALAGQFLGAGNPRMARKSIMVCTGIAVVIMSLLGVVFFTQAEWLTRIISREPVHMEHTPPLLQIAGLVQVFFALNMVVRQGLRGVGDTRWTFSITTFSSYAIRLPMCWFFGIYLGLGLTGIWYGLCGELVIRASMFTARFLHGGWTKIQV